MNRPSRTGYGGLPRALTLVGALALAVMMLWTIADVVLRAVAHRALDGTVALVETLLVLVAFFALADCMARDEMIRVDILDDRVGKRTVAWLAIFGDFATACFLGLLVVTLATPLADAWRFGDVKPDLPIPIWTLVAAIEVALVAATVVVALKVVRGLRARLIGASGGTPAPAEGEGPR